MAQGGRASSAMPLLPGTRASNERLVFVKNVPSYVPEDQIAELFAPYKPLSIKNIYKGSSITTIVVGFGSRSDAVRAQRNTDGKSLGSAVIKVEMYEQRRSLRYIKGQEQANLASSAGEEEGPEQHEEEDKEEEEEEEEAQEEARPYFPPLEPVRIKTPNAIPRGITWARIAGTQFAQGAISTPANLKADDAQTPSSTPIRTPQTPVDMPIKPFNPKDQAPDSPSPAPMSLGDATPDAIFVPPTLDALSNADGESEAEYGLRRWTEILGWAQNNTGDNTYATHAPAEPFGTTARIQYRHSRDCAFCRKRERR
ncbi:hypothetical protein ACJBU6_07503 [Exserohilum turcicum]